MDSYTDVSAQCCNRDRMPCGTSCKSGCGTSTRSDYPDMSTFPWDSWESNTGFSYPTQASPISQTSDMTFSRSCPSTEAGPLEQQYPVAMAYVPWQQWQSTYAPERGLVQGTIFPELDLQFNYGRCGR